MRLELHLQLKSDTTFGRGDGVAGLVDEEVEYDTATGLPFLRGRTLKGLLVEECANLLFALDRQHVPALPRLQQSAQFLFGKAGSKQEDEALMHVGAARLPTTLEQAVRADVEAKRLTPADVLESLTALRRQTAVDEASGAPDTGSLRTMRVVLRETLFIAPLDFAADPEPEALALLAACVMALRRAGTGRNRGRGRLVAHLCDTSGNDITASHFAHLQHVVQKGVA